MRRILTSLFLIQNPLGLSLLPVLASSSKRNHESGLSVSQAGLTTRCSSALMPPLWVPPFVVQEGRGVIQVSLPRALQILCHSEQPSLLLAHWKRARIGMVKRYNWRRHFYSYKTRTHTPAFVLQFAKGQSQTFTQGKDSFWEKMSTPLTETTHLPGLRALKWAGKTWNGSLPQLQSELTLFFF